MKNNIKKIITTTMLSAVALTTVGTVTQANCCTESCKTKALEISKTKDRYGKIVETTANNPNSYVANRSSEYLTSDISSSDIENELQSSNNVKLYILSESPFMSFTSDENGSHFNMVVKFETSNDGTTSNQSDIIDSESLCMKKSILMIYASELLNGNITLTETDKTNINNHLNTNTNSDISTTTSTANVSYKNKLSETDIDAIIEILENNLNASSPFSQSKLSTTYNNLSNNISNNTSENAQLAQSIVNALNFNNENNGYAKNIADRNKTYINSKNINNRVLSNNSLTNSNSQTNSINTRSTTNNIKDLNINDNNSNNYNNSRNINNDSNLNANSNIYTQTNQSRNTRQLNNNRSNRRNRNLNTEQNTNNLNNNMQNRGISNMSTSNNTNNNFQQNNRINENKESYTNTSATGFSVNERAERVPYTTNTTFNQQ